MLGYMKFYLKNDEIIFEDDLYNFQILKNSGKFLEYL